MSEFLNMGGYALYVWGSYGAAGAILVWNLLAPRLRRSTLLRELSTEE